ncbi:MAG: histidinol-phosphatase HisJ [Candidatus Helarchaeota archaeon]
MLDGLIDAHVHTKMCHHATGELHEYVEVALSKNLDEIGFSEHFPMNYIPENIDTSTYCITMDEVPIYINNLKKLQETYPDIKIKIATEADYIIGKNKIIEKSLSQFKFDYIIGSVHVINDWCFDDPINLHKYDELDILNIYKDYFHALEQAINSKLFNIIGHLDLVKKFGFRPDVDISFLVDPIIDSLKKNKVCIELNTSGDRKPVNEFYPSKQILEKCYINDIPISLGSDAHKPEEVGWKFREAVKILKDIGYTQLVKFNNKKIQFFDF